MQKDVTKILTRAGSLLSPTVVLSATGNSTGGYGYQWIQACLENMGLAAAEEAKFYLNAASTRAYPLPRDFVQFTEEDYPIYDCVAGDVYGGTYSLRRGNIAFPSTGSYLIGYIRPLTLTHKKDDTSHEEDTEDAEDSTGLVNLTMSVVANANAHFTSTDYHTSTSATACTSLGSTDSTTLAPTLAALTDFRSKWATHLTESSMHINDDNRNNPMTPLTTTSTAATDSTNMQDAANEAKRLLNAHVPSGLPKEILTAAIPHYLAYQYEFTKDPNGNAAQRHYAEYLRASGKALSEMQTADESRFRNGW